MATVRLIKPDGPSDRELVSRTIDGNHGAYALLVERYQRKIHRVARAIVGDDTEAESIVQETFVTAYLNLAGFEGRSELETWLTRIAINKARDLLRSRKRSLVPFGLAGENASFPEPVDGRPDAEQNAIARQLGVAIDRAIDDLSAQQKVIFRLRLLEDLPLEEIARLMGLRPGTVRAHLFRAVHKVRGQLEDWMGKGNRLEETT